MKTAKDLMTSPVQTLPSDATLVEAAQALAQHNVGSMPLVDGGKLVGVVTDRDIVVNGVAMEHVAADTPVSAVASKDVVTVAEADKASKVADTLAAHKIRRVPVIDASGKVVGVISQADVARELGQAETGEVVQKISQ